jgi:hypothetical protein
MVRRICVIFTTVSAGAAVVGAGAGGGAAAARSTSSRTTRPPGRCPGHADRSTPWAAATLRASGVADTAASAWPNAEVAGRIGEVGRQRAAHPGSGRGDAGRGCCGSRRRRRGGRCGRRGRRGRGGRWGCCRRRRRGRLARRRAHASRAPPWPSEQRGEVLVGGLADDRHRRVERDLVAFRREVRATRRRRRSRPPSWPCRCRPRRSRAGRERLAFGLSRQAAMVPNSMVGETAGIGRSRPRGPPSAAPADARSAASTTRSTLGITSFSRLVA